MRVRNRQHPGHLGGRQLPPRGAGMPRSFKADAMPKRVVTPSCCSAWISGEISAARLRAMMARAMALAPLPFRTASLVRVLRIAIICFAGHKVPEVYTNLR